ncbi:MAG: YidC/Oxa1 family membrane protein insertase [Candidatus Peregrinibacteria bacterium]
MKINWSRFLLFFLIALVVLQFLSKKETVQPKGEDIALLAKTKFTQGNEVQVQVKNYRETPFTLAIPCPTNPLKVEKYDNGEWKEVTATIDPTKCQAHDLVIETGKTETINFGLWSYPLFNELGRYQVSVVTQLDGKEKVFSREFEVVKPGFFSWIGHHIFYRPIFNTLIYLISIIPNHDFGWGIILLTLIVKILLLGPNQRALKSQKSMQRLQPELDALKLKFKDNQAQLAQETMALWKKHKVSPLGSCLPMIIQFPILIALFYVVRDGLSVLNPEVFYEPLRSFDLKSMNVNFLGVIDLTMKNVIVLPVVVGVLQFLQMHLSLGKTKHPEEHHDNPLANMSNVMKYTMPVMIAFFTASLPAAVGFYWGTSTLFGIAQQWAVNKMKV